MTDNGTIIGGALLLVAGVLGYKGLAGSSRGTVGQARAQQLFDGVYLSVPVEFKGSLVPAVVAKHVDDDSINGWYIDAICAKPMYNSGYADGPLISVNGRRSENALRSTMRHEYGHFVWWQILTDAERREFASAYANSVRRVSAYAGKSVEEGFAEDFRCWMERGRNQVAAERMLIDKFRAARAKG